MFNYFYVPGAYVSRNERGGEGITPLVLLPLSHLYGPIFHLKKTRVRTERNDRHIFIFSAERNGIVSVAETKNSM